ncbi:sigma-70 family RNA polymerase sigma factor [bacterium]|nr:sigma-70 family RNA polymerase sigma factor [bacterium]
MGSLREKDVQNYIQKSLSGDARAFEWIVRKFQKRIYYAVLKMVMNHDDANDVLQETFIKAYTKLNTYDDSYPFYPWLYRIAINTSLNHQKKKHRLRALSLDNLENNNNHRDLSESPKQMFDTEGGELIDKVKQALGKIPPEQRAVFLLRVRDELSYQEISDTLEISIGTVMSRLSRAREKLRNHLHEFLATNDIGV